MERHGSAHADTNRIIIIMTPKEAAERTGSGYVGGLLELDQFIIAASARELQEYIHRTIARGDQQPYNRATIALSIRLAEDAAKTTDKLIQHTEKLTTQTDEHIKHAKKLTEQTNALVTESRNLTTLTQTLTNQNATIINESQQIRLLTWGLLTFTVLLLAYTIWHDCTQGK
jgi:hypothetical protein